MSDFERRKAAPESRVKKRATVDSRRDNQNDVNENVLDTSSLDERISKGQVDHKKLYYQILKNPLFLSKINPILAKDPKSPIVIILEDRHGSPEIDLGKMRVLYDDFGIDSFGVEGWAGYEADKARGRLILNGEIDLIEKLLVEKKYDFFPLEEPKLQIEALKYAMTLYYFQWVVLKNTRKKFGLDRDELKRSLILKYGIKDSVKRHGLNKSKFMKMIDDYQYRLGFEMKNLEIREGEDKEAYLFRMGLIFKKISPGFWKLVSDERSRAASKLLVEKMRKDGRKVSVLLFGSNHADEIESELQERLGDCSIFRFSDDEPEQERLDILEVPFGLNWT